MSWDSRSDNSFKLVFTAFVVLLAFSCSTLHPAEYKSKETKDAIFCSLGRDQYIAVIKPDFMTKLYGVDWYKQRIFAKSTYDLIGQTGPPMLLWKLNGLVFQRDLRGWSPDANVRPFIVTLYSLDKKLAYNVNIDFANYHVTVKAFCHTEEGPEKVYSSGALVNGIRCKKWETLPAGNKVGTDQSDIEAIN